MSEGLCVERDGRVVTLTINRPDCRNALNIETYLALAQQITQASDDQSVSAVILTGAAGHFTAGNDLRDFQAERGSGDSAAMTFLRALIRADVPIVAAVEGYAIGIGVTLLQHCDFAYAADNATLRMPFVALGLCPEGASSLLMPRLAGARKAAEWLMLGHAITAEKACEAGLLNAVTPAGGALAAAHATAADLASQPPAALRLTKSLLKRRDRALIEDVLDNEAQHFSERLKTDEAQAAFARFFKKNAA